MCTLVLVFALREWQLGAHLIFLYYRRRVYLNLITYSQVTWYQSPCIRCIRTRNPRLTLRLLMSYIFMEHLFLMFLDHTQRRSTVGKNSSGRVISSSQRPLPDNTRHSQQKNIHAPGGIWTHDLSRWAACGRSPAEILGSNPTGGMDIFLLWVSCVVR